VQNVKTLKKYLKHNTIKWFHLFNHYTN